MDDTETVALAMEYELTASDAALKSLFAFLEGYGAVEEEAQRAINLWVGTLLLKSTESADVLVSAEDLISALLGTSAGRPLKIANVLPRARDELRGFVSLFASPPPRPVQRRLVQEIEKAASEHSLVLVYGGGGSGKTVALIEFAASRLGDSNSSVGALTAVDSADRASADLVRDIVRRWAGLSPSAGERMVDSAGEAIQRLVTANPDVERPVLCICLDGIDEAADGWDSNLREAMAYFARQVSVRTSDTQPIGTLVVTCRDPEDIARRYLGAADRTTGEVNRGIYGMVEVQEFDDVEFGRAWMTLEAGTVAERLMSVVDPHDLLDVFSEGPVPIASSGLPTRPPDPLMMESLHHPVVWRAFSGLDEASQHGVLDGSEWALNLLAEEVVGWFCRKASLRRPSAFGDEEVVRDCLEAVATQATMDVRGTLKADWFSAAGQIVPSTAAYLLYREAGSAGLIEQIGRDRWRWRHEFVGLFLRHSHAQSDSGES